VNRIAPCFIVAAMIATAGPSASAQDFALRVGPVVAASPAPGTTTQMKVTMKGNVKDALFLVQPLGCAMAGGAVMSATAEGLLDGRRQSVPLALVTLPGSDVHVVHRQWPVAGQWVVRLTGRCADQAAGALVALGPSNQYSRDRVTLLAGPPTAEQVEAALSPGKTRTAIARQK
jgi:hypothetical protein